MASYSYINGVYQVTTQIRDGFTRFHGCNAQERKLVLNDDLGARFIVWQLISYDTAIAQVMRDIANDEYVVYLHNNPYSYSPTTSRQFNRWISEKYFSHLITPMLIRRAYDECEPVTHDDSMYVHGNIRIEFRSGFSFNRIWR